MPKARKCTPVFADEHCLHLNKVYAEAAGAITALTEQLLEKTPTADLLRLQGVLLEAINGPIVLARLNRVLGAPRDDISTVLEPGDPEHTKFAKAWKAAPGTARELFKKQCKGFLTKADFREIELRCLAGALPKAKKKKK